MTARQARVGIIGGGVVGTSILFHLATRHGISDAVLFERDQLAAHSTSSAVGGVRYTFDHPLNIALGVENLAFYREFEAHVGEPLSFRENGYLFVYRDEVARDRWRARHRAYAEYDTASRQLDPDETAEVVPGIDSESILGALFAPDCGHVDPYTATSAFASAATDAGSTVLTDTTVKSIQVDGARVTGLETDRGRFDLDVIINAAGPWAPAIASSIGIDIPIELIVRRIVVTDPPEGRRYPLVIDTDNDFYFESEANGSLLVCDTAGDLRGIDAPESAPRSIRFDYYSQALGKLDDLVEGLGDLEVINDWAGIQSHSPDGHAILGPTSADGFVLACGFTGHGVMQAPTTGAAIADLVATGDTDVLDVDALGLDRFDRDDRIEPEAIP